MFVIFFKINRSALRKNKNNKKKEGLKCQPVKNVTEKALKNVQNAKAVGELVSFWVDLISVITAMDPVLPSAAYVMGKDAFRKP